MNRLKLGTSINKSFFKGRSDCGIRLCFGFALDCASDLNFWKTATLG